MRRVMWFPCAAAEGRLCGRDTCANSGAMRGLWEEVGADSMVRTDLRRFLERMVEPDGPGRIKKEGEIDALGDYQALRCDTLPAEVKGQKYIEAMVYQCHNEMRAVLESEADPTLAPSNPGTVHLNALELDGEALCVLEHPGPRRDGDARRGPQPQR